MPKRTSDYRESLLEDLKDPREAACYLNAALEDSDEMFLVALRNVAEARQMAKVAEGAGISRESIYRMLSDKGNPRYSSLSGLFSALGLEFIVRPSSRPAKRFKPGPREAKREASREQNGRKALLGKSHPRPMLGKTKEPRLPERKTAKLAARPMGLSHRPLGLTKK